MTDETARCTFTKAPPDEKRKTRGQRRRGGLSTRKTEHFTDDQVTDPGKHNEGHADAEPILEFNAKDGHRGVKFSVDRMVGKHQDQPWIMRMIWLPKKRTTDPMMTHNALRTPLR